MSDSKNQVSISTIFTVPVSTLVAQDEGGHGLVGRPCLELVVGTVALLADAALEEVRFGALSDRQVTALDAVLHELGPLLLHLVRRHLL